MSSPDPRTPSIPWCCLTIQMPLQSREDWERLTTYQATRSTSLTVLPSITRYRNTRLSQRTSTRGKVILTAILKACTNLRLFQDKNSSKWPTTSTTKRTSRWEPRAAAIRTHKVAESLSTILGTRSLSNSTLLRWLLHSQPRTNKQPWTKPQAFWVPPEPT